jgi:hypothetical protein
VSCRDARAWSALLEHRFAELPEPAEWPESAAHLAGCAACLRLALAIDPTLVFQRLPEPAAPPTTEVEAMRQAVAGLRRARELGVSSPEAAGARRFDAGGRGKLVRAAAAAALVIGLGSQVPLVRRDTVATVPTPMPVVVEADTRLGGATDGSLGVSGDVGRPSARVYQIAYRDVAVVMVVDKSLDL